MPRRAQWKDAPVADGFVHQLGSDRAIDAAADSTYDSTGFAADLTDASDFLPNELLLRQRRLSSHLDHTQRRYSYHSPVAFAATDIAYEPGDDLLSPWGVCHLWMELNAVEWFRIMSNRSVGRGFCMADDMEIWRGRRDLITVGHPHLQNPAQSAVGGRGPRTSSHRKKHKNVIAPPFRLLGLRTRHRRTSDRSQTC